MLPNAVVYTRVSTKEQARNLSLETQEERCAAYCEREGLKVIRVFVERGESAKTTARPQFQQMLAFCKQRKNGVSFVVVYDLSRFSRDMEDQLVTIGELNSAKVLLRSITENVDESPAGKLMRNTTGAMNQFDNDKKSERTKQGMTKAASMGRFPFKAPLGYINLHNQRGANLAHDPERAPLILKAFELFAEGTRTKSDVRHVVTNLGLKTHAGEPVSAQTFQSMMRNVIYAGWVAIPMWGVRERGNFDAIVPMELFDRVQELLDGRRPSFTSYQRNHPDFPLRLWTRCGVCGTPLTGSWSTGRKKAYPYYRCRNSTCSGVNIRAEMMEDLFRATLDRLAPNTRDVALFKTAVRMSFKRQQADADALMRAAKERMSRLEGQKQRLVEFFLEGKIDQLTYNEQSERFSAELKEATMALRSAEAQQLDIEDVLAFATSLIRSPRKMWDVADLDGKQRLQRAFFPSGVTFKGKTFGTDSSTSFFDLLGGLQDVEDGLASPTGFEPVLPP